MRIVVPLNFMARLSRISERDATHFRPPLRHSLNEYPKALLPPNAKRPAQFPRQAD